VDLLLRAAGLLKDENLDFQLVVIGKGRMEEWVRGFVQEKKLGDRVSIQESIPDPELAAIYEGADCVVIPSRSESIPLVFSEALRFEKDLIVSDVGDMGTLGRTYGVARVFPPEDWVSLKEEMKEKIEGEGSAPDEGRKGKREELLKWFSVETSVERFLADYS
jgi:glycosyltransferase involved in cell wall biosynthesis